ncbi:MAG: TaqI-like C-terminal specificity domain-containing protein, partial [Candidatus Absconditicoccaceae bacterium]
IPGAGSADITLGNFTDGKYELENIQVVCELKGAKTNLIKKQFGHGGLSPVGQGFAYKTGLKNCKRLIVSNFYEIRLYRDNTTDFEVRNLDELMDPKADYFNLRKLYLLLHKNNLLTGKTEHLLSHFREEQKEITTKFYKEYKELRIDLINDMKYNNPGVSIETIIEKAQKIIDRLIFIFFCEDNTLLPEERLKKDILEGKTLGDTPWERIKKYFQQVDTGHERLQIPNGFNGGLFAQDEVLNNLNIGDSICKKFVDLTNYNFDDQLSVKVLGHIFEQSISDLENLKIDLLGTEVETDQLKENKGRRKKDGIFYTPEYIVDYIVQNSVMKYLNEKEDECLSEVSTIDEKTSERRRKKNIENPEQKAYLKYQQILQNIKVLDPACGSGAFLVRVFDVLFEENKRVGSILNSLFDETETYKNILTNNIYGVDLNEESVEITKLSLRLKSAQKGKKLNNLDANIKCGNSLIDDPAVAGDKAFDWKKEFSGILGYGMKLPMKLGQKKEVGFDIIVGNPPYVVTKKENEITKLYKRNSDLYLMFFEKTLNTLVKKGEFYFGFITPRFFLVNKNCLDFRKFLLSEVNLTDLVETSPFEDAQTECVITLINSSKDNTINIFEDNKGEIVFKQSIKKENFRQSVDYIINTRTNKSETLIVEKTEKKTLLLKDISISKRGLEVGKPLLRDTKDGVKCLIGQDVNKYSMKFEDTFISVEHKDYKRLQDFFIGNKIYLRRVAKELIAYYDKNFAFNKNIYGIKINNETINEKYILCLLNSRLLSFYYKNKFTTKKGDLFPEIQTYLYEQLPIKEISLSDQQPFIERADKMLSLNKELHELTDKFLHRIQDNLKIQKLTKKLQSFYEGEFKDFLDELKKQKIPLSLSEQDDRESYFKEYKEKILLLKGEIERTDKEIDEMVYKLYGLTEEEIKVVESK